MRWPHQTIANSTITASTKVEPYMNSTRIMKTQNKQVTRSNERMHSDLGWLNSRHSFSFGGITIPSEWALAHCGS